MQEGCNHPPENAGIIPYLNGKDPGVHPPLREDPLLMKGILGELKVRNVNSK